MGGAETIEIEVVYALPGRQRVLRVHVATDTSVAQAVRQSGILREFPEVDPERVPLGIFGRRVSADTVVRAGDRVELYRTLTADPKAVRRAHAASRRSKP